MANRFLSNIKINDAYTFPASDGTSGQVVTTDGAGNLGFSTISLDSGSTVIYQDNFTGDNLTTTFTLANSVNDEVITQVYIDGVYQSKLTYSTSGDQLIFTEAPFTGASIEVISMNSVSYGGFQFDVAGAADNDLLVYNSALGRWENSKTIGDLTAANLTATSFIKSGGTSSQFLKADGSVDSNTYLTSFDITTQTDPKYLRSDTSDTMSGNLTVTGISKLWHSGSYGYTSFESGNETNFYLANGTASTMYLNYNQGTVNLAQNTLIAQGDGVVLIGRTSNATSQALQVEGFIDQTQTTAAVRLYNGSTFVGGVGNGQWGFSSTYLNDYVVYAQNDLLFTAGGGNTPKMTLNSLGNVGIGTTSPSAKLEIFGTGNTLRLDSAANQSKTILLRNVGTATAEIKTDGNLKLWAEDAGRNIYFDTSSGTKMTVLSGGNVGIGTTSPAVKFHVEANSNAARFSSSINSVPVSLYTTGNSVSTIGFKGSTSVNDYNVRCGADGNDFVAYTNNVERMRIDANGNIGIGTTSPSAKLEVVGEAWVGNGTDGIKLSYSAGNSTGIVDTEYTSTGLEFRVGGSEKMRIDDTGVNAISGYKWNGQSLDDRYVKLSGNNTWANQNLFQGNLISTSTLYLSGAVVDRNGSSGNAGQLLSNYSGSQVEWIDSPAPTPTSPNNTLVFTAPPVGYNISADINPNGFTLNDGSQNYFSLSPSPSGAEISGDADISFNAGGVFSAQSNSNMTFEGVGQVYIVGPDVGLEGYIMGVTIWSDLYVYGTKNFRIDHPLKPETNDLVHSCIESPTIDLHYRGVAKLVNGIATINIDENFGMTDGTFEAINRNVQVFTTNETDWTNVRGRVIGNTLTIEAQNPTDVEVSWLVIGERCDESIMDSNTTDANGKLIVEPIV